MAYGRPGCWPLLALSIVGLFSPVVPSITVPPISVSTGLAVFSNSTAEVRSGVLGPCRRFDDSLARLPGSYRWERKHHFLGEWQRILVGRGPCCGIFGWMLNIMNGCLRMLVNSSMWFGYTSVCSPALVTVTPGVQTSDANPLCWYDYLNTLYKPPFHTGIFGGGLSDGTGTSNFQVFGWPLEVRVEAFSAPSSDP
jgi:hypothetical protein